MTTNLKMSNSELKMAEKGSSILSRENWIKRVPAGKFGGVANGIAVHYDMSVVGIRLLIVALMFLLASVTGPFLALMPYIFLWVLMPKG